MSMLRLATEAAGSTIAATAAAPLAAAGLSPAAAPAAVTPGTLGELRLGAPAAQADAFAAEKPIPVPVPPAGGATGTVGNALTALVQYIPTEVVTLYVAAVSVGAAFKSVMPSYTPVLLYWVFVAMTPIIFYLVFMNQVVSMKQPIPVIKNWPRWKPVASTISFGIWAMAIPNNPYIQGEAGAAVAGFAALFISTILSLVAPIIERPS